MIPKQDAARALERALRTGGDFAELFAEDTHTTSLQMLTGCLQEAVSGRNHGAGIRVFKGMDTVYVYTNDTSPAGLLAAADRAADAIAGKAAHVPNLVLASRVIPEKHPVQELPFGVSTREKVRIMTSAHLAASSYSKEITQVQVLYSDETQNVLIANSQGLWTEDARTRIRMHVYAVASGVSETQTGHQGPGYNRGFEAIRALDADALAKDAARQAVTMLHADYCKAGRMPVAIENGFGGVIFHEACGHALEATSVGRGNSVFCGKLGQPIAAPCVTAVDDGTIPNAWGSRNIDDEGQPTRRNVLIEQGILKNYLVDRLGAMRLRLPANGCARRQSYAYAATSRMSNTFIVPGEDDDREIIATMGDGLYCASMGGGSVNPLTGDFNFAVTEGYLVKDGKIDRPVRGATLIGKGADVLWKIDRVGKNLLTGQGMCGSLSGSIPTDVGQPLIRVREMTVGGR